MKEKELYAQNSKTIRTDFDMCIACELVTGTVQTTAFNPNQVVRSLNGLTDNVTLSAGSNITIASQRVGNDRSP